MTKSEQLAAHFASIRLSDLPDQLVADVKTLVLDYFGVALRGSRTESAQIAQRFVTNNGGVQEATLIGSDHRVPAVQAAYANAISSHSIELDDVDKDALFHFSPPVVSAALATGERQSASGADLVVAVALGCEMMARASNATNPSLRNRGFHTTPTTGVFGAAIAASRLMQLNTDEIVSALGLAGAQASGLMEMYGPSMQKRFNPGPAARDGVTAAEMAQLGFTGADTIFEGERGFGRAYSDSFDEEALTDGLGSHYPIYIEYKPYSCARPIHNAIDCALDIRRQMSGATSDIVEISLERHPDWAAYHLNARPSTYHEAQVSLPYSVGVALVDGAALLPQYQDERLVEPELLRLAGLVSVIPNATLKRGVSCRMQAKDAAGKVYVSEVDYPLGSIENPMSEDNMSDKVHLLADEVIGEKMVTSLIEAVRRLEQIPQVRDLFSIVSAIR